jgi:hypothetical protein
MGGEVVELNTQDELCFVFIPDPAYIKIQTTSKLFENS